MRIEFETNLKNRDGSDKKRKREIVNGKGELIKEYEHFYLVQMRKYRTCINKYDIMCGQAKIRFLGV